MKLSDLKVDSKRLEQGGWVDNIPEMGELRLRVRGIGNADYRRLQSKLFEAIPRNKRAGGRIDPDEQDRVMSECLLDAVLLDWDGLTGDDDQPLPYSREQARVLLFEPEFQRFRQAVVWAAGVVAEDGASSLEADAGNSGKPSAGNLPGAIRRIG